MRENLMVYHPSHLEELYHLDELMEELQKSNLNFNYFPCRNKEEVLSSISEVDFLITASSFPEDTLEKAKSLKWIQVFAAGVESLAFSKYLHDRGIILTRLTGTFGARMAEYVIAHMLATSQKIPLGIEQQRNREWKFYRPEELYNKTLGVIGLGSIGKEVARKSSLLGMNVHGLSRNPLDLPYINKSYQLINIAQFVSCLDFLVLALPLTPESIGLINKDIFDHMRSNAWIINIARGQIIVEEDLVRALNDHKIEGAVLDVFEKEPLPSDSELWKTRGVRITPHMSGSSIYSEGIKLFIENYNNFKSGIELINMVDLEKGY